jgi:hypothetical protein
LPQKHLRPFAGIARNPTVDLTVSIDNFKRSGNCYMHTHSDHFDTLASEKLQKTSIMPTCRQRIYGKANFVNAEVKTKQTFKILPSQEQAENTGGEILAQMGEVGFVLQAENEPTYILLATAFGWKR